MPPNIARSAVVAACADMIRACGLTLAELADELAKPVQLAPPFTLLPMVGDVNIDAVHSSTRSAPSAPVTATGRALSLEGQKVLALADNPEGATVVDVGDTLVVGNDTANYHVKRLTEMRLLTRIKVAGERSYRYFSNPGHALGYVERRADAAARAAVAVASFPAPAPVAAPAAAALSPAEVRSVEIHAAKVVGLKKAPPPMGKRTHKPAPHQNVTFSPPKPPDDARPKGEAITTEKTVETRDTTVRPTAKWQTQDLPPDPRYPSFSSMRPGMNPDTGKAWEGRA